MKKAKLENFPNLWKSQKLLRFRHLSWALLSVCFLFQTVAASPPYTEISEAVNGTFTEPGLEIEVQQRTVSGRVTDAANSPLPGVTIIVKGTTTGTVTNADGEYSIPNLSPETILVFSFLGMQTREIIVGDQTVLNVTLTEDLVGIEEVVAVGYGTQSRRYITGSVASADMSIIRDFPNINIAQTLSDVPGILFTGSGRPGQDGAVLIRGQNSLSADNNPLVVVDGIIFSGALSDLNPNDIERVDVLKDASAASVYGSRAANGVILITSKKGTTERPTVALNVLYGISDVASRIQLLSPERYVERRLDYRRLNGLPVDMENIHLYLNPDEAENYLNGRSVNEWDLVTRRGSIGTYNLSISGRAASTNYYLSASMSDDKGLILNDQESRTTVRANVSNDLADWITVGVTSTYSQRDRSGTPANLNNMYRVSPWGTFFHEDGSPRRNPVSDEQAAQNPLYAMHYQRSNVVFDNLYSNLFTQINIPFIEGLSYRMNYSPNIRWSQNYQFFRQDPYWVGNTTNATKRNTRMFDWVLENIVTYRHTFADIHNVDFTFLYGHHRNEFEATIARASEFEIDLLGYNYLDFGTIFTNSSDAIEKTGISTMARLNYQLMQKYMASFTVRRDGSSVFAAQNKYATFPSVALGWMISDEPFMQNAGFVNSLKIRLSYGSVGNEAISPYQSLTLSGIQRYVFGDGGSSVIGLVNSGLGNENLRWETVYSTNAAVDFSIFNNRFDGTIEFYNSSTKDLLVEQSIPTMNGFTSILTNIGETNNQGIELTLNSLNVQRNRFRWNSVAGFAFNKNKIVSLYGTDLDGDGREDDDIANSWFIGHPIGSYYDYVFDGIYQVDDTDIPAGSMPGFVRIRDHDGNGVLDANDRTIVGKNTPDTQFSFRNTFRYGNVSLSVFVNGMFGWVSRFNLINPLVPGRAFGGYDAGWWTPENRSNTRPSLNYSNPRNMGWYVSRDFVRIRDVAIAYDFDQQMLDRVRLSGLRVSLSVKNLYTFTNWLGTDPENASDYTEQGGNDLFPMPRTVSLGMNVNF
jgi:TonB-linked SusC/RagA family outer membrane protein